MEGVSVAIYEEGMQMYYQQWRKFDEKHENCRSQMIRPDYRIEFTWQMIL